MMHSSLKSASLDLDLSSTGMSTGRLTGREEKIQFMDMPDDDSEVWGRK